ncbi:MAG: hypothetical protein ACEPOZ_11505 [Marinifilaceae bacterium]
MSKIKMINYWRAVFTAVPLGIASLVIGINKFVSIPATIDDLVVVKGIPKSFGTTTIKSSHNTFNVYYIQIGPSKYRTIYGKERDLLVTVFPTYKNEEVKIWHNKGEYRIRKLAVGEKVLIEYHPPYWIAHVFFCFGLVLLISSIVHIIKHPEDMVGGDKEKFKKFWDDW